MSERGLLLILLPILALQVGCRGTAEQSVRAVAFAEATRLRDNPTTIDDPVVDAYLDELAEMVLTAARELEDVPEGGERRSLQVYDEFDVVLVHSAALNAWVYGDNFVCITSNLVLQADTPEELMAVLCHEFAHLEEAHLVETKERELAHVAVGQALVIAGGIAEIAASVYGLPIPISSLANQAAVEHVESFEPNRPSNEFEADREGFEIYAAMGLDLDHFDDPYERMLELSGDEPGYTHPLMSHRLERIEKLRERTARSAETTLTLDQERFESIQDRLCEVLCAKADRGQLIAFEEHLWTRAARGDPPPRVTACGPISPDRIRLQASLNGALRHHERTRDQRPE